jgi:transcriptional regulator with XRE-family HTH domain
VTRSLWAAVHNDVRAQGIASVTTSIKELRQQAGLTQTELARRAGVSKQAVSQWESGRIKSFSADNLFKVAEVLGVDAKVLLPSRSPSESLLPQEQKLLNNFRALREKERKAVLAVIAALTSAK